MSNKWKGNAALLITAMIWGSGFIASKLGMHHLGPFTYNGMRQCLGALFLTPLMLNSIRQTNFFSVDKCGRRVVQARAKRILFASLISGTLLSLGSNAQQMGLIDIDAGRSGFITAIYIVMVPIFGMFFGRRSTMKVWISVIIALIGFALLSLKTGGSPVGRGDLLTLLCAAFFALQIIAVGRLLTANNAIILAATQMMVSGLLSLILMLIFERPDMAVILKAWMPILYSALLPTATGYTLQLIGQKYTDPTVASLLMSLESVFAALFGVLMLGEMMSPKEWLGCALIFAATFISQMPSKADKLEQSRSSHA